MKKELNANDTLTLTYLALGDSYTIGESVSESERYPIQLKAKLGRDGIKLTTVKIVAQTGWTTENLISGITQENLKEPFDIVSLLIGVNNQYQDKSTDEYATDFQKLLCMAISFAGGNKANVFVLSIPDYSVTPFAANSDTDKISSEIAEFNAVNKAITENAGVKYLNVTPISLRAKDDPSLLANDGLHPSGKMYGEWIDLIYREVKVLIKARSDRH